MKTIFRFFSLGLLLTALVSAGATATFAQDDAAAKAAKYERFMAIYNTTAEAELKEAIEIAKQYVEKYGATDEDKQQTDYMKSWLPSAEKRLAAMGTQKLYKQFDDAFKAEKWTDVYAVGKQILAKEPENLDVILVLGSIGYDQAFKKNNAYNAETVMYAKKAIEMLEAGKTSKNFGVYQYTYKNKENALGWMNLTIGFIENNANNNRTAALPYLYRASTLNSDTKSNPLVFESIGRFYFDEVTKLADQVKTMIAAQSSTDPQDVAAQKDAEIKAKVALLNGYAERAMDAYARAYKVTKTDAATKPYRDGLYKTIQNLYNVRFAKQDGLDTYISSTVAKPMPDPSTAVTPVVDEPKAESTTGTTAAPATVKPTAAVKPAVAAPTAVKPTATKVVAKKKGTR